MSRPRIYLDYTFDDELFEPFGRQIDARVYYHWNDYNPGDDSDVGWGAVIDDVEVLSVREFDREGNSIPVAIYPRDLGWGILQQQLDEVREACTQEGARLGLGRSHPLYRPRRPAPAVANQHSIAPRMAPSARDRRTSSTRKLG